MNKYYSMNRIILMILYFYAVIFESQKKCAYSVFMLTIKVRGKLDPRKGSDGAGELDIPNMM